MLETHEHQVEQLVHGGLVELHDAAVRYLDEDLLGELDAEDVLGLEELIDKVVQKHCLNDLF